jgi:hypothetical protein
LESDHSETIRKSLTEGSNDTIPGHKEENVGWNQFPEQTLTECQDAELRWKCCRDLNIAVVVITLWRSKIPAQTAGTSDAANAKETLYMLTILLVGNELLGSDGCKTLRNMQNHVMSHRGRATASDALDF